MFVYIAQALRYMLKSSFSCLSKLSITAEHITLKELPRLKELYLNSKNYQVQHYPTLIRFNVARHIDLRFLSKSPLLQTLIINWPLNLPFDFPNLQSVEELFIYGIEDVSWLPILDNLKRLYLSGAVLKNTVPEPLLHLLR